MLTKIIKLIKYYFQGAQQFYMELEKSKNDEKKKSETDNRRRMRSMMKRQMTRRYVNCEYKLSDRARETRSASPPAPQQLIRARSPHSKRRMAFSDLSLCHFKICNMGKKRSTRQIHYLPVLFGNVRTQRDN